MEWNPNFKTHDLEYNIQKNKLKLTCATTLAATFDATAEL